VIIACGALIGTVVGFVFGAREASALAVASVVERGFTLGAVAGALVAAIGLRRTRGSE
jgi:hypothetical protein